MCCYVEDRQIKAPVQRYQDFIGTAGSSVWTMVNKSWCDDEFGWGPLVKQFNANPLTDSPVADDGNSSLPTTPTHFHLIKPFTLCFCSTILELPIAVLFTVIGIQSCVAATSYPQIKPMFSTTYSAKIILSSCALLCSAMLQWINSPQSYSNIVALGCTTVSWMVSILLLSLGNRRRLPQKWYGLRGWWLAEFCVQLFIFAEHSALHPGEIVHIVRGVSMGCCMLLFLLNFIPVDQEAYEEIKLDASTELSYGSLEDDKQGSEQVEDDPDRVPPAARSRMMRSLSSLSQALFGDKELSSMSLDKDSERTPLLS